MFAIALVFTMILPGFFLAWWGSHREHLLGTLAPYLNGSVSPDQFVRKTYRLLYWGRGLFLSGGLLLDWKIAGNGDDFVIMTVILLLLMVITETCWPFKVCRSKWLSSYPYGRVPQEFISVLKLIREEHEPRDALQERFIVCLAERLSHWTQDPLKVTALEVIKITEFVWELWPLPTKDEKILLIAEGITASQIKTILGAKEDLPTVEEELIELAGV